MGLGVPTGLTVGSSCASARWCLGHLGVGHAFCGTCIFVGHEGAKATFPGPRGEPQGHRMARRQESPGRLVGSGVHDLVCRLAGTFRTPLWWEQLSGERARCQPSEGMNLGPEAAATPHWRIDTSLPRTEALGEVSGARALPRKVHSSFREEKKKLVSAAGTAGNPPRGCGTAAWRCPGAEAGLAGWDGSEPGRKSVRV